MTDEEKEIGRKFLTKLHEFVEKTELTELKAAKKNLFQRIANAYNHAEDTSIWYLLQEIVVMIEKFKALYG